MFITVCVYEQELDIKTCAAVDLVVLLFMHHRKVVEANLLIIEIDFKVPAFIDAVRCVSSVKNAKTTE